MFFTAVCLLLINNTNLLLRTKPRVHHYPREADCLGDYQWYVIAFFYFYIPPEGDIRSSMIMAYYYPFVLCCTDTDQIVNIFLCFHQLPNAVQVWCVHFIWADEVGQPSYIPTSVSQNAWTSVPLHKNSKLLINTILVSRQVVLVVIPATVSFESLHSAILRNKVCARWSSLNAQHAHQTGRLYLQMVIESITASRSLKGQWNHLKYIGDLLTKQ